jgi:AcrR family transcriptional regulator
MAAKAQDKNEKSTRSAADWEQAAVELISEKGVQALAIEPLARRMGIT